MFKLTDTKNWYNDITEFLDKYLTGKKFLYKSKTGHSVKGEIASYEVNLKSFAESGVQRQTPGGKKFMVPTSPMFYFPNITIISTTGVKYNLITDEIYIR